MTAMMMLVTALLLGLGMIALPPLSGSGVGSVFARAWLLFGLLVFFGHYLHYAGEAQKRKSPAARQDTTVRLHLSQAAGRNEGQK